MMTDSILRLAFPFLAAIGLVVAPAAFAANHEKGAKPIRISQGQKVDLADFLVPGKTTIFDFTSEFCPPCRAIAPHLDRLHANRADISVVKVDINRPDVRGIDWNSPVAGQYAIRSVPHFKVYGPDGRLVAEGDEARRMVIGWIEEQPAG
jgi:thiol-disulfide isomerase/thioredoxin